MTLRWTIFLLVGAAAAVFVALGVALSQGCGLTENGAIGALALGAVVGAAAAWHTRAARVFGEGRVSPWSWAALTAFGLFAFRAFCWLVFYDGDRVEVTSPNNVGDLSLHLMLTHYFANGAAWWPDHPQYAWGSLRYYPGIDLLQALLQLTGAAEFPTLVWMGLLGSAATALALYLWGGGFGVAAFLFSGGLAGFEILQTGNFADYQADLAWKSLPLAIFVTQRGFLFALPAGLLLMTHWRQRFFPPLRSAPEWPGAAGRAGKGLLPFWVEGLLYAAMPVFHLFTFVFLSLLLGWWFVVYFQRNELRRHLVMLVAAAVLPASVAISEMTAGFTAGGGMHLRIGWMQEGEPFLWFWLKNFGLFAPLAAGLWLHRMWPGRTSEVDEAVDAFVLPAGLIFLFSCVVMFSAWEWDNTKIMLWCYLAAAPFLWERCLAPFAAPIRWPACAALFFSGAVCVIGGLSGPNLLLATRSEVEAVRFAVRDLPIEERFAAAPAYNHPLVFAGRKLAMGYEGQLRSLGIDYEPLARDLRALMLGEDDWQRAERRLGVRYLYWGAREEKLYPDSAKPWAVHPPVASGTWGALYDLR